MISIIMQWKNERKKENRTDLISTCEWLIFCLLEIRFVWKSRINLNEFDRATMITASVLTTVWLWRQHLSCPKVSKYGIIKPLLTHHTTLKSNYPRRMYSIKHIINMKMIIISFTFHTSRHRRPTICIISPRKMLHRMINRSSIWIFCIEAVNFPLKKRLSAAFAHW